MVVHMNREFGAYFTVTDPENKEPVEPQDVHQLQQLTPYGMLLASLGTCTCMVVLNYAKNHNLPLEEMSITLEFGRAFQEDCEHCEEINRQAEIIREEIAFYGSLSSELTERLFRVSHLCPINQMLQAGTKIDSSLAASAA